MFILLILAVLGLAAAGWGLAGLLRKGPNLARAAALIVGLGLLAGAGGIASSFVGGLSGSQVYTYQD